MKVLMFLVTFVTLLNQIYSMFQNKNIPEQQITDDPLILTPLIEQNKTSEAKLASRVYLNGFQNIESFSGYFTVDKIFKSNLFFWFFPNRNNYCSAPVILWLQGGPGASSLLGLFVENGPFSLKNNSLILRKHAWTNDHSVIYIDSPAGTGYSFTNEGYVQNQTKVGQDLYIALIQFFTLFPELQKNDFYVAGESYGGKFGPAIAYTIHQNNANAHVKINLKGLSIGNGLCDSEHQLNIGDYLYQLGLIDDHGKEILKEQQQEVLHYIQNKNYTKASKIQLNLISIVKNLTGFDNVYNFLYPIEQNYSQEIEMYLHRSDVRTAIHVGKNPFSVHSKKVFSNLESDPARSVAPWLTELLSNYRVLIYNGQFDMLIGYPLTVNFLKHLNFNGADQYKTATRYKWYVNSDLAGYVKQAGNLTEVLVRAAGHRVPTDQPVWALDLISKFTNNKPFH